MPKIYLKAARENADLNQTELSAVMRALDPKAALSQSSISRLENDATAEPFYKHRAALARALHVAIDDLRFGPDPRTVEQQHAADDAKPKHEARDARPAQ